MLRLSRWIHDRLGSGRSSGERLLPSRISDPRAGDAPVQIDVAASAGCRNDELLAMLSHELRSPLASMHYAVSILARPTIDDSQRKSMQALIERQIGQMTRLVDDLQDVSRMSRGRTVLRTERCDLRAVVRNAVETLEPVIADQKHRLAVELPDAAVWLRADPGLLEQVFVNLVANASRYTDSGGELRVQVQVGDGQAIVRVRDTGIGIQPEALLHIFELFRQGNEADPRSRAGLGVGLAVVRNLVELHGGRVEAESDGDGRGSEFTVRLPAVE